MSQRGKVVILVVVVLVAVAASVGYVLSQRSAGEAAATPTASPAASASLAQIEAGPRIVFRSTALGPDYGKVAVVALDDPSGPRAYAPVSCDRVYATTDAAICLSSDRGLVTTYSSTLLDAAWQPTHSLPITGIPSRARLSRDGSLAATTNFAYGDSYANPGEFSTRTYISRADGSTVGELEKFTLVVDGKPVTAANRNFWGVTFADDETFYATAASGGTTWLVKGSIADRTMTALTTDVECPSLSPDRTRIAYKQHGDLPAGQWRLAVLDLATLKVTQLAEKRSVDDQVAWLDDATVMYGLPRSTAGSASSDVWTTPADGSGTPKVLISDAWSPAVVKPPSA